MGTRLSTPNNFETIKRFKHVTGKDRHAIGNNRDSNENNRDGIIAPPGPIQTPAELWQCPGECRQSPVALQGSDAGIALMSAGGVTVYQDAAGLHRGSIGAVPATTGALLGLHRDKLIQDQVRTRIQPLSHGTLVTIVLFGLEFHFKERMDVKLAYLDNVKCQQPQDNARYASQAYPSLAAHCGANVCIGELQSAYWYTGVNTCYLMGSSLVLLWEARVLKENLICPTSEPNSHVQGVGI
ncbi:hypothetical protein DPMN_090227 [Dreissena polymorpha]|uniref:Uncharacterized protein n=1 Tax=Dreissena polymorpha TaxID=45954 RepID=A0A9D4QYV7_DREPO|nr:hypothetical protein DPMN_090227 [Dreissena polymorpha]